VGWVDLACPQAPARIAYLAAQPKLRALRPMLQSLPEDWILAPELVSAVSAMQAAGLRFDALVRPGHLPYLQRFAATNPGLLIVIDHAATPTIAEANQRDFDNWCRAMAALAALPNVYCKLSGLLTEAAATQGVVHLRPYIEFLCAAFGAERLLWGSDWPVLKLAANETLADYASWLALAKLCLPPLNSEQIQAIFADSCKRFYQFT
jgi:L-fuconolactonase